MMVLLVRVFNYKRDTTRSQHHVLVSQHRVRVYNYKGDTMTIFMGDTMMVLLMVDLFHNIMKSTLLCTL